jgi:hypothetical protein
VTRAAQPRDTSDLSQAPSTGSVTTTCSIRDDPCRRPIFAPKASSS